jgi:predicted aspartyl protease
MLLWGNQSKSLRVLIDSGADESFMDANLASELDIPTQPLSIPMYVRTLDGCSIDWVTHNTNPINLRVSGIHSETIQFLLIKSPQVPVVSRFSWFQ